MNLHEIGPAIECRRIELGLTQERLAKLAKLSRSTIVHLEKGSLKDLGATKLFTLLGVLGMDFDLQRNKKSKHALENISQTVSVSYKEKLKSVDLANSLASGKLPDALLPHVATMLDEAPVPMIVQAVEEVAQVKNISPKVIWKHINQWSHDIASPRKVWQ
jgi:transcriptional regulator with XRE-family HTH domain